MNLSVSSETSDARSYHAPLLAAALLPQAAVFYIHVVTDVARFYPPILDQLTFYLSTYDLIDGMRSDGVRALLSDLFQPTNPTGTTFAAPGAFLS